VATARENKFKNNNQPIAHKGRGDHSSAKVATAYFYVSNNQPAAASARCSTQATLAFVIQ